VETRDSRSSDPRSHEQYAEWPSNDRLLQGGIFLMLFAASPYGKVTGCQNDRITKKAHTNRQISFERGSHGRLDERIEAGQRHFVLSELEGLSGDRREAANPSSQLFGFSPSEHLAQPNSGPV
jgi:hypothetical protein